MVEELPIRYVGDANLKIPLTMQCPVPISYGPMDKYLSDAVKTIRGRMTIHLNRVDKYLDTLDRVAINTDGGYNNLFKAIRMQLHVPKRFTEDMMRHQLSSYLIERVEFFYPQMVDYLKSKKLTFTSYVIGVYNGRVWADEFLIGAIGMMYNVRITVVSPYFSDVWNIFHDGRAQPDIVLVCNGQYFGSGRDNITHFSGTRGKGKSWQCVGSDQRVHEIGLYSGYTEGRKTAIDLFTITINRELLFKTNTMLTDVNRLCRDVNAICVERDQVIEKLDELKITLGDFKRLTSYYVEEENTVRDNVMPPKERTVEIVPSFARAIPKIRVKDSRTTNFGQQLVNEAFQIISEDCNTREEEVSCEHEMSSGSKENGQHQQHEDVSTDSTHLPNESLQTMNGNTSTHKEEVPREHEVSNITHNKRQHCERQHTTSDKKRFKQSHHAHVPEKAPVSETKLHLEKEKKIKKQKHSQVKVHTTKKPKKPQTQTTQSIHGQTQEQHAVETITKEFHSDQQVNTEPVIQTIDRVSEDDVAITQSIDTQAEQDHAVEAIMKELNNENDVNTEPDVQVIDRGDEDDSVRIIEIDELIQSRVESLNVPDMLPEEENDSRITGLFDTRLKIPGMKVVTVQPIAYDDELFGDKLPIVSIDIKQEIKEEIIPDEHTPTATTSNHQELDASQQHSEPNTIQGKLSKILPTQKPDELQVHIPQSSTSVSALRYQPRQKKVDRRSVTVHKQIDETTIQGPIPKKDQLDNMFYCDKCPKSFKDKAYCRKHMTRLCPALTDIQCLKCPHCDKMYRHDKNYREHLSIHDGIKRFKCGKCGEKFFTDMQVLKHRTLCCAKK